ncbi:MAG TPA: glycosyltransferase, partial [Pseudonocardiaceae bacterium]|nr:glycosyltransferase [Pseudonocardiaceae bacterium]
MTYTVVIPTIGRPSLGQLVSAIGCDSSVRHSRPIIVVDDRPDGGVLRLPGIGVPVRVLRSGGRGPAAARNVGWRAAATEWVVFLDDDVLPGPGWAAELERDLRGLGPDVAASQGRIEVPLPADRRPTDFERGTAALARARWITADMAYRRAALLRVGGFDERFRRAYREDSDLALRVIAAGYRIVAGQRRTIHPVRPSPPLASVSAQRGNADNALMRRRHGPRWRHRIGEGPGRLPQHILTAAALTAWLAHRVLGTDRGNHDRIYRGLSPERISWAARAAGMVWLGLTGEFAVRRILAGPWSAGEIGRMVVTSVAIPPVACWHRLAGEWRWRGVSRASAVPAAVLFDRDGTLVHDVPYNGDPAAVRPVPGARAALRRLRGIGIPVGVVTN